MVNSRRSEVFRK